MKYQDLFSLKNKKKNHLSSAAAVSSALKINDFTLQPLFCECERSNCLDH